MIKEQKMDSALELVEKFERNKDIDIIKEELIEYQEKQEKEESISDILLESHRFFNDIDSILRIIALDLRKQS